MKSPKSPSRKKPPPFPGEEAASDQLMEMPQSPPFRMTPSTSMGTIRPRSTSGASLVTSNEGSSSTSSHSSSSRSVIESPTHMRTAYPRNGALRGRKTPRRRSQSKIPALTPRRRSTFSSTEESVSSSGQDSEESADASATESSCMSAITTSASVTPIQLMQSYGYVGMKMISDESDPFDLRGSVLEVEEGCRSEERVLLHLSGRWDEAGIGTISETLLADEVAPFDLAASDSLYPLSYGTGGRIGSDIAEGLVYQKGGALSTKISMATPTRKGLGQRTSWSPGAPNGVTQEDDGSPNSKAYVDFLSLDWPLPPRKAIVVHQDDVEIWTEPIVEVRLLPF
ncbi:hypothetical protein FRB95_001067 [Tulasnella sp. JGI-2019a]|nr:hypothetical protein FRB95_001067 [Tulasnella sp. JGI-2019a]